MRNLGHVLWIGAWTLLAAGPASQAQNLIVNGELDDNVLDWFASGGGAALTWDTLDHDSCGSASGSGLATNGWEDGGQNNFMACVTGIVPGAAYSVDGFLRIPTGETATGGILLRVYWTSPDCDGASVGIDETTDLPSTNQGVWVHKAKRDLVAPAGATSALVGAMVYKDPGAVPLDARFDGIHFVAGHGFLFGDGFESETTCRWSDEAP